MELGGEIFAHDSKGPAAAPQTEASTMIDIGGYYHFKHHPSEQFLFCHGHSIVSQPENYAYLDFEQITLGCKLYRKLDSLLSSENC